MSFKELGGRSILLAPMILVLLSAIGCVQAFMIKVQGHYASELIWLASIAILLGSILLAIILAVADWVRRREAWLWKLGYLRSLGPAVVLSFNGPSSIETGPVPQGMQTALETLGFQVETLNRQQLDYARQNAGWLNHPDNYLGFECTLYKPTRGEPSARVYLNRYYNGGKNRFCLAWFDTGYRQKPITAKDGAELAHKLLRMANTISAGLCH